MREYSKGQKAMDSIEENGAVYLLTCLLLNGEESTGMKGGGWERVRKNEGGGRH
jgi:hypothetical protein